MPGAILLMMPSELLCVRDVVAASRVPGLRAVRIYEFWRGCREQPAIDPFGNESQFATTAETRGAELPRIDGSIDRFRAALRARSCFANSEPR